MNLADELLRCFVKSIKPEIDCIQESGVLDHCPSKPRGPGQALNSILKEDTLRLFALRALYEATKTPHFTFQAEYPSDMGWIDLVLSEGDEQYAFELKRWQRDKEAWEVRENDYEKLTDFMGADANHHEYSLIFTVNENKDIPSEYRHDKPGWYKYSFENDLSEEYDLRGCEAIGFNRFPGCALLVTPKREAQRA
jgi:hypothetical protein